MIAIIGTSDQSCWLAEARKIVHYPYTPAPLLIASNALGLRETRFDGSECLLKVSSAVLTTQRLGRLAE